MKTVAVYPGSFDPITLGHVDIIQRISKLYDEIIVLVAISPDKKSLFSTDEKIKLIKDEIKSLRNVKVDKHEGLTVDYVKSKKAKVIVRGLRSVVDFEYELSMGNMNKKLAPEIETVIILASPEFYFVSSRAVKEVARNNGSLSGLVSGKVETALRKKVKK